jgi:hypothetical protein
VFLSFIPNSASNGRGRETSGWRRTPSKRRTRTLTFYAISQRMSKSTFTLATSPRARTTFIASRLLPRPKLTRKSAGRGGSTNPTSRTSPNSSSPLHFSIFNQHSTFDFFPCSRFHFVGFRPSNNTCNPVLLGRHHCCTKRIGGRTPR